jgi:hypothetical protein
MSARAVAVSPVRIVVLLACAAFGTLLADVEWLRATADTRTSNAWTMVLRCDNTTSNERPIGSSTSSGVANNAGATPPVRITYTHVQGRPYRQLYGFKYACDPKQQPGIRTLPDDLTLPGLLDFQTDISTSLKVAVVGDSIGVQIGHRLEEAMQPTTPYIRRAYVETNWNNLVASYPVRGGGALLSYRVNGLFWDEMQVTRRRRRRQLRRKQGRRRQLQSYFKPQRFNRSEIAVALRQPTIPLGNVDVMVQRVTYPWIPLAQITHQALERNTLLAAEMFGMETLVYVNMYFTNNVVDADAYNMFLEKKEVVRDFVRTYVPPPTSGVKRLLLLDLDRLVDLLNERNARSLGIDTAAQPFEEWMLSQTLGRYDPRAVFRKHIGQVCGSIVPNHTASCDRNMIFVDGLHFCPSTFAGRITGGLACLVECAELDRNTQPRHPDGDEQLLLLRKCERTCNDKYMSLEPIPRSEMVQGNGTA